MSAGKIRKKKAKARAVADPTGQAQLKEEALAELRSELLHGTAPAAKPDIKSGGGGMNSDGDSDSDGPERAAVASDDTTAGKPVLSLLEQIKSASSAQRTVGCHGLALAILLSAERHEAAVAAAGAAGGGGDAKSKSAADAAAAATDVKGMKPNSKSNSAAAVAAAMAAPAPRERMGLSKALLHFGTAKELIALLADADIAVTIAAAGALRNLCGAGGQYACDALIAIGILEPVFKMLMPQLHASQSAEKRTEMYLQSIGILTNLCENSDVAVDKITAPKEMPLQAVIAHVVPTASPALILAALRLLTVATGDNPNQIARRFTSAHVARFTSILNNNKVTAQLRVAAAGVLVNIRPRGIGASDEADTIKLVFKGMTAALDLDPFVLAEAMLASLSAKYGPIKQKAAQLSVAIEQAAAAHAAHKAARKAKKAAKRADKQAAAAAGGANGSSAAAAAAASGAIASTATPAVAAATAGFAFDLKSNSAPSKLPGPLTFSTPIPQVSAVKPKKGGGGGGEAGEDEDDELSEDEKALQLLTREWDETVAADVRTWCDTANAVQQAIEILANLCVTDDGEADAKSDTAALPEYLTTLIQSSGVMNKILAKIQKSRLGPVNASSRPEEAKLFNAVLSLLSPDQFSEVHSSFTTVRVHALNCLGNMLLALPANMLGDVAQLFIHMSGLCAPLATLYTQLNSAAATAAATAAPPSSISAAMAALAPASSGVSSANAAATTAVLNQLLRSSLVEEMEALSTILWHSARKLTPLQAAAHKLAASTATAAAAGASAGSPAKPAAARPPNYLVLGSTELTLCASLARTGLTTVTRVAAIGTLTQCGLMPQFAPHNLVIGGILLEQLDSKGLDKASPAAQLAYLEIACEAVNGLIDVYTEDKTHTASITSLKLLDKLKAYAPNFVKLVKSAASKVDPDLSARLQETATNLNAFLVYKPAHV